ncbi:MAG: type II toxin-antitoxin system HicB family antitoxin [bacterium]|nr:type II toxin-antitoxin system HicB family antitoxin [bacterium]MDE0353175.1 type II toxin-antitoxin system HicB family antitoxin [bacterium]
MQEIQLTAVVRQEDGWFVAQALEVDVASQGESPDVALDNLAEALELHFEPPRSTVAPQVHHLRVKVGAA